ncbi:MAG: ABC transporter permease subunit [Caulobacteraceae bacterium]
MFGPVFAQFVEHPADGRRAARIAVGPPPPAACPTATGILAASIIVAMMVLPFIAATLRELLLTVPAQVRESAYGLGATTGEVVMKVTLPYVRRGAIGAVMLGLGRAPRRDHGRHLHHRQRAQLSQEPVRLRRDHRLHHRQRIRRGHHAAATPPRCSPPAWFSSSSPSSSLRWRG